MAKYPNATVAEYGHQDGHKTFEVFLFEARGSCIPQPNLQSSDLGSKGVVGVRPLDPSLGLQSRATQHLILSTICSSNFGIGNAQLRAERRCQRCPGWLSFCE